MGHAKDFFLEFLFKVGKIILLKKDRPCNNVRVLFCSIVSHPKKKRNLNTILHPPHPPKIVLRYKCWMTVWCLQCVYLYLLKTKRLPLMSISVIQNNMVKVLMFICLPSFKWCHFKVSLSSLFSIRHGKSVIYFHKKDRKEETTKSL